MGGSGKLGSFGAEAVGEGASSLRREASGASV